MGNGFQVMIKVEGSWFAKAAFSNREDAVKFAIKNVYDNAKCEDAKVVVEAAKGVYFDVFNAN